MSAKLALTTFAREDFAEARIWYDQERPGLGDEFAADFYAALHAIEAAPSAQTPSYPPFRRRRFGRFPYSVLFHIEPAAIYVVAVVHRQRSPEFVLAQLNRRPS